MKKEEFKFEAKPTNPTLIKIFDAILARKFEEAEHSDPGFVLDNYTQKEIPPGYVIIKVDIISKTKGIFTILATLEKTSSLRSD
ncbi:MAG: hypothetical protein H7319_09970 [Spirosoma sp.]|nr:hypothetical protein [Spirosoma sp.]